MWAVVFGEGFLEEVRWSRLHGNECPRVRLEEVPGTHRMPSRKTEGV